MWVYAEINTYWASLYMPHTLLDVGYEWNTISCCKEQKTQPWFTQAEREPAGSHDWKDKDLSSLVQGFEGDTTTLFAVSLSQLS